MPARLHFLALLLLAAPHLGFTADVHVTPRRAQVICHNGKPGSGGHCRMGLGTSGKLICGIVGKVSEITWRFVGLRDGKDVYDFTRRFPLESENVATQIKQVEFAGERVILFEDKDQVIAVQSPKP
ncbi:hypothetical protein [Prosthecobacter dejongeii]|uniref:Uncharacterized protein n=1 Tax=Prosthecobacter dejongeii TaxID=48465 RepID=A0A7W8DQE4_9BACT|nr:hypothetical protein [Prosthecobacter dejongeii]MBB5038388.1 hypothetical protein [Prosthecobacter dejongeii]